MSLYSDYLKERLGFETIELEDGFITYEIKPPYASIEEFYVEPSKRGTGLAKKLADLVFQIAKEHLCHTVLASVTPGTGNAEHVLRTNLHYGFKLASADNGRILLKKEIEYDNEGEK